MTVARHPWDPDRATAVIAAHRNVRGGLLPALRALQEVFGYIDDAAVPLLADVFNLSRADVFGVVTFYHDFRRRPPGGRVVKICRADACRAMGAERLAAHAVEKLGVGFGETARDGATTLEAVYCLGNCALSPSVMVDDRLHGRVTPRRFDALIDGENKP